MSKKLWYTWVEMRRDVNTLCRAITLDKFDPDCIIGISRGGLTPGVMVSHYFEKPFKPIKAALRDFPDWEDYLPKKTDRRILIVDDICDGGGTFLGLAQELKAKNAGNLYLAVSHGIFSRGFEDLEKVFTKIYTTDSFKTITHENCEQIELKEILR